MPTCDVCSKEVPEAMQRKHADWHERVKSEPWVPDPVDAMTDSDRRTRRVVDTALAPTVEQHLATIARNTSSIRRIAVFFFVVFWINLVLAFAWVLYLIWLDGQSLD